MTAVILTLLAIATATSPAPTQKSRAIQMVLGAPIAVVQTSPPIATANVLGIPASAKIIGNNGSIVYFTVTKRVIAADIASGRILWKTPARYETDEDAEFPIAVTPRIIYVAELGPRGLRMVGLSARDGSEIVSVPDAIASSYADGTLYSNRGEVDELTAADPDTAKVRWRGGGGALGIIGPASVHGSVVLQPYQDSSGKSVDVIYAFDKHSGRQLWYAESTPDVLGFGPGTVYLNTVWFNPDSYVPMTLSTIDLRTGKTIRSYDYKPDPQLFGDSFPGGLVPDVPARVVGRYFYMQFGDAWYRYIVDRSPGSPYNLTGLNVKAWFMGNRLLLISNRYVFLGVMHDDSLELHELGQSLRSSVTLGSDGTQYAVVDNSVLAFDPSGRIRFAGKTSCEKVEAIVPWRAHFAVICDAGLFRRAEVFATPG